MASVRKFKIALVQMEMADDPRENLARAAAGVREAAGQGAKVVCLPELFRTRYFCQSEDSSLFDLAEPVPGETTEALAEVARETGAAVIAPIFERRAAGLYHNSAVTIGPDGRIAGLYRKMHIPDDPGYYEKFYFTPGDLGFRAFDVGGAVVGVGICWDQWYPEAARLMALAGAEVLFFPTAIGYHPREKERFGPRQLDAWRTIQRAHAIANGVYVAAVNRVGLEKPNDEPEGIEFWGCSFVCGPFGEVPAEAPLDRPAVLVAEVDPARVEEVRRNWPFLRDRRIDAYGGLSERFGNGESDEQA